MYDTEDKLWWCEHGLKREYVFVDKVCPMLHMSAMINPEKKTNIYAPDAVINDRLADIKSEFTPFFTSDQYGFDPQYTVTFNVKDRLRYEKLYPDLMIYFWVNWEQTVFSWKRRVNAMWGVWEVHFPSLCNIIDWRFQTHPYERRMHDEKGNAKESYLVDVRELTCLKERPYFLSFLEETE